MTPVKVYHSAFQGKIAALLYLHLGQGEVLAKCAIQTAQGTKVADVAWSSTERFNLIKLETQCSIAPEICVEILSKSNSQTEIMEKMALYFSQGALEVWLCSEQGSLNFYNKIQEITLSQLVPTFPKQL